MCKDILNLTVPLETPNYEFVMLQCRFSYRVCNLCEWRMPAASVFFFYVRHLFLFFVFLFFFILFGFRSFSVDYLTSITYTFHFSSSDGPIWYQIGFSNCWSKCWLFGSILYYSHLYKLAVSKCICLTESCSSIIYHPFEPGEIK